MLKNFVVVVPIAVRQPSRYPPRLRRKLSARRRGFGELARNAADASVGVFVFILCLGGEGRCDEAAHTSADKI